MGCLSPTRRTDLAFLTVLSIWCAVVPKASQSADTDYDERYPSIISTVRWETDAFSACSVRCGGGLQHRLIRCVREDLLHPGVVTEIPTVQCPSPMPNVSQSCSTHACLGQWKVKVWSQCSVSCGEGVQKRDVTCESFLWKGHQFQVAAIECGGPGPQKYRKCYERDCSHIDRLSQQGTILSENYTLIQIRRTGRLKLNVGGKVKILPGQTVMVKCPVRHFSRRMVYWSKGNKMIPHDGRVKVTSVGLRIQKADPKQDGGVYTCMAGEKKATISIQFTGKRDPLRSSYRLWAKKSRRRYRKRHPKRQNDQEVVGNKIEKIVVMSPFLRDGRQRDQQSVNVTNTLMFVTGNWSECSVTCGRGVRQRKVYCAHGNSKYVKIFQDEDCFKQGLKKPSNVRACVQGPVDCPVWRPGPWSKCDPWCGDVVGRRSRILVCEWDKSGQPAWNACDMARKPPSRKPCKPTQCPKTCRDSSSKCRRVLQFKMCRYKHFREKCCQSCQNPHHPNNIYSSVLNNRIGNDNHNNINHHHGRVLVDQ